MISKWKIAALSVVTCMGTLQIGCTDREIVTGVAAGFLGAAIMDSAHRNAAPPPSRCQIVEREYCPPPTYDYYGRMYRSRCVYERFDSCSGHRYRKMSLNNTVADLSAIDLSETYKLSIEGASKLIAVLQAAESAQDDASARDAMAQLGLTVEEVRALGSSGVPSADMVDRVAKALNQEPKHTQMMLNSILETARAQQAARNQPDAA